MKGVIIGFIIFIFTLAAIIGKYSDDSIDNNDISISSLEIQKNQLPNVLQNNTKNTNNNDRTLLTLDSTAIEIPHSIRRENEILLCRIAYTISYNKDTKCPNWVAWHLTAEHTDGPYPRLKQFHEEEELPAPRATLEDYKRSGWSRGHMCPAGDNKWDAEAMYESFSLANVCPQNANLNSGLWNSIEMDCRKWARKFGDIYIVCGPVYLRREHETIGYNKVYVPEAFFKVVLCLNGTPKGFGFIVRNTDGNKKRDLYYNSIDQVERITGYDFFPALPDSIENEVEAKLDMNLWY